jgi:hypothetical protein
VSTIGSSEAIILSVTNSHPSASRGLDLRDLAAQVLAAKRRWQNLRKAAGKPYDKPNLVMNAAVQVCCTFALFFWSTKWCSLLVDSLQGRKPRGVR